MGLQREGELRKPLCAWHARVQLNNNNLPVRHGRLKHRVRVIPAVGAPVHSQKPEIHNVALAGGKVGVGTAGRLPQQSVHKIGSAAAARPRGAARRTVPKEEPTWL
jgi:hypothetical protein